MAFERRKLIHNDGIEVKGQAALLYEPLDVLAVDDVNICRTHQGTFSFLFRADRNGVGQYLQLIPFFNLCGPSITGNTQRCDYQNAVRLEAVKQKVKKGRERDRRLAKTHVE